MRCAPPRSWPRTRRRRRAEVAENSVLLLGEQVAKLTQERDALKIDVAFFQKQIGAMQRAAAQQQAKPKK